MTWVVLADPLSVFKNVIGERYSIGRWSVDQTSNGAEALPRVTVELGPRLNKTQLIRDATSLRLLSIFLRFLLVVWTAPETLSPVTPFTTAGALWAQAGVMAARAAFAARNPERLTVFLPGLTVVVVRVVGFTAAPTFRLFLHRALAGRARRALDRPVGGLQPVEECRHLLQGHGLTVRFGKKSLPVRLISHPLNQLILDGGVTVVVHLYAAPSAARY